MAIKIYLFFIVLVVTTARTFLLLIKVYSEMFLPKKIFLIILVLVLNFKFDSYAQINIGISFIGLSFHLKKPKNPTIFTYKLNKSGRLIFTRGTALYIEKPFYNNQLALRFEQAILSDCASKFAGFSFLSIRVCTEILQNKINVGIGPGFYYRKTWNNIPAYQNEGLFKDIGNFQTKFIWHAGNLSISHPINENYQVFSTFIPAIPELFVLTLGAEKIQKRYH